MQIEITQEQMDKIYKDSYCDIVFPNGAWYYLEFGQDNEFTYAEISNPENVHGRKNKYAFNTNDLDKLVPRKPTDPSYYHDDPLCPSCGTYMIYKFECCPRCGQAIDWRERNTP